MNNDITDELVSSLLEAIESSRNLNSPKEQRECVLSVLGMLVPNDQQNETTVALWWEDRHGYSLRSLVINGKETPCTARRDSVNPKTQILIRGKKEPRSEPHPNQQVIPVHGSAPTGQERVMGFVEVSHPIRTPIHLKETRSISILLRMWLETRRASKRLHALESFLEDLERRSAKETLSNACRVLERYCGEGAVCRSIATHPLAVRFCDAHGTPKRLQRANPAARYEKDGAHFIRVQVPAADAKQDQNKKELDFIELELTAGTRHFTLTDELVTHQIAHYLSALLPDLITREKIALVHESQNNGTLSGSSIQVGQAQEYQRYQNAVLSLFDGYVEAQVIPSERNSGHKTPETNLTWKANQLVALLSQSHSMQIKYAFEGLPNHDRLALIALISEIRYVILKRQDPRSRITEIREVRHAYTGGLSSATGNLSTIFRSMNLLKSEYQRHPVKHALMDDFFERQQLGKRVATGQLILKIMEDFMNASRIVMSEMTPESLQRVSINLDHCVEEARQLHNVFAESRGLEIRTIKHALAPREFLISADKVLLQLALSNLLDNAIKYSFRDSPFGVEVQIGGTERKPIVRVSNKGIPIVAADLQRIFEPFTRITNQKGIQEMAGTGLGLAAAKRVCLLHGGDCYVECNELATTTFTIQLGVVKE